MLHECDLLKLGGTLLQQSITVTCYAQVITVHADIDYNMTYCSDITLIKNVYTVQYIHIILLNPTCLLLGLSLTVM